jgi:stage II sporulation protein M
MKKKSMGKKKKQVKKDSLDLKKEYQKTWKYIKETKIHFLVIAGLFILTTIIGFVVPAPEFLSQEIMQVIQEIIEKTQGMNSLELISFIIANNVQTSFLGMIFGLVLGIFPIITTVINGYLLGFVAEMSVSLEGPSTLLSLIPHGIFELPAIIISLGLGLKLGGFPFQKNPGKSFKEFLENSVRAFILIVLPLLLIAGIIEGTLIFLIN